MTVLLKNGYYDPQEEKLYLAADYTVKGEDKRNEFYMRFFNEGNYDLSADEILNSAISRDEKGEICSEDFK